MDYSGFFSNAIAEALNKPEPGSWIPSVKSNTIRLSAGYPDRALVPIREFSRTIDNLIQEEADLPFHYIGSEWTGVLRGWVRRHLASRGMEGDMNDLLISAGAIQSIDLVARVLLDESRTVAVEAPTYMEALEVFQNYTEDLLPLRTDEFGLCVDEFEDLLEDRYAKGTQLPSLLYTIPSFQNPTGSTMPIERRRKLLALAEVYDFLILEDDAYGELSFTTAPKTLKSLDKTGRVIHVGSLSKVVGPGLRIGWTFGPEPIVRAMNRFKKDLDHTFVEAAVGMYLEHVSWDTRLDSVRRTYQEKRDVMVRALRDYMPDDVIWNEPDGGYFTWLRIPGVNTKAMLPRAVDSGVAYIPGPYFYVASDAGGEELRLSFSYVSLEEIRSGVQRLAEVIRSIRNEFNC